MKLKKRIVIFGNQQAAIDCARWIGGLKKIELVAFVGCERPRDKEYGYPSVRTFCKNDNIPFYQPEQLDDAFFSLFESWRPELCLSIYYRNIFSKKFLNVPLMGFINLHPSLLPKYRGAMPTLWAQFNGEKTVGITLHHIDEGIDSGDIITQKEYKLPRNITGYELHTHLMQVGVKMIKRYFFQLLKHNAPRIRQHHADASYYSAFNPNLRTIDWFSSSDRILSRMRALTRPYDGAITHLQGKNVIFWKARKYRLSKHNLKQPGKIIRVFKDGSFIVSCVDGFLHITDFTTQRTLPRGESIALGAKFR